MVRLQWLLPAGPLLPGRYFHGRSKCHPQAGDNHFIRLRRSQSCTEQERLETRDEPDILLVHPPHLFGACGALEVCNFFTREESLQTGLTHPAGKILKNYRYKEGRCFPHTAGP